MDATGVGCPMSKKTFLVPQLPNNGHGDVVRVLPLAEQAQVPSEDGEDPADHLSWTLLAYLVLVTLLSSACIAYFARDISWDGWQGFVTLVLLAIVFEKVGVNIYGETLISAGVVALFAIGIVYGAPGAAIAAPLVLAPDIILIRGPWYDRLFGMGFYTLANVSAALVFHGLVDIEAGVNGWWVAGAVLAIITNYAINASLMSVHLNLQSGERFAAWPLLAIWRENGQWLLPYFIVFGLLGLALAAGYLALGVAGILAFVAPPLMMRVALHQYVTKTEQTVLELKQKNADLKAANLDITQMAHRLAETYNGTLEALVLALDARDRETKGHSLRVTQYALTIARQAGVGEESPEWVEIQRGALLHDVGKIGVPDYILHKPGPLTPEEWDEMKRHPKIGHEMLKEISFLSGAAAIVHAHHERFDGKGYPRALAGDETPLGARIFSVADAFDAMTSHRPYRSALPPEAARDEIIQHSGTQFDPEAVQAFLLVYERLVEIARAEHEEEYAKAA